jgi:hypothetical protein
MSDPGFSVESLPESEPPAPAQLEFRATTPDGRALRQLVKEGATIGRSGVCDLVIDEVSVNLIHARVVWGMDGGWDLMCVGRSVVELQDEPLGQTCFVDRLALGAGTRFWVGGVEVECAGAGAGAPPREPSPGDTSGRVPRTRPHTAVPGLATLPRFAMCPQCFFNLSSVAAVARFCPKCGGALPQRDEHGVITPPPPDSPLFGVYEALRVELTQKLIDAGEVDPGAAANGDPAVRSLIVLAYASALLNLGWRYEHGRGLWRNLAEAGRCYEKAGRLAAVETKRDSPLPG